MHISETTAVVTGAASGLGAATASRLAERGARVIGFDLEASISGATAPYDLMPVDVTDPDAVAAALDVAADQVHPLRIVVSCAGIAPSARILSRRGPHDPRLYAKVVQVNLIGTFHVLSFGAERIAQTAAAESGQRGVVINTASIAGYEGQVGQAAYASSKAGVIGLTVAAARDLAQYGIRVNTIAPGVMETPMLDTVSAEYRGALAANVPFPHRLGLPAEYAQLAAFLIEHDYINGETVRMDGALRMAAR